MTSFGGFSGDVGVDPSPLLLTFSNFTRISREFLFLGLSIVPALLERSERALFECLSPAHELPRSSQGATGFNFKLSTRKPKSLISSRTRSAVDPARSATARSLSNCVSYESLPSAIHRLASFYLSVDRGGSLIRKLDRGVTTSGSLWSSSSSSRLGFSCTTAAARACFRNSRLARRAAVSLSTGGRAAGVDSSSSLLLYASTSAVEAFVARALLDLDPDDVENEYVASITILGGTINVLNEDSHVVHHQ